MGEILRALEGPIVPMLCASHDPNNAEACGRTTFCTVNLLWVRVRDAITQAVDSMTLAELATPRSGQLAHPPAALTPVGPGHPSGQPGASEPVPVSARATI